MHSALLHADEFVVAPTTRARKQPVWVVIVAAVLVVAGAGVFVLRSSGSAEAVSFRYGFVKGEKSAYNISLSIEAKPGGELPGAQPFQGTMGATLAYEVVEEKEDGSAVLEMKMSNVTFEPSVATPPGDSTMRVRIAPDGRVASVEGVGGIFGAAGAAVDPSMSMSSGGPTDSAGSQFLFPQFPQNAIKPGDSWQESTTFPMPFGTGSVTMKSNGTLTGYEESAHGQVARLHHTVEAPLDMSFSFADLASQMAQGATGQMPPGMENARFIINGKMQMDAESLVVPNTTVVVQLDGTANIDMSMKMEGLSGAASAGAPENISFEMVMKMSMTKVDVAGAAA